MNNVVFLALSMIVGAAFCVNLTLTYFKDHEHGSFEWTGLAILFGCLIFVLLAPNYF